MNLLERVAWGLTGVLVFGVIALIALQAAGISFGRSVISDQDIEYDFAALNPHLGKNWSKVGLPSARGGLAAAAAGRSGGAGAASSRGGKATPGEARSGSGGGGDDASRIQNPWPDAPANQRGGAPGIAGGGGSEMWPASGGGELPIAQTVNLPYSMAEKYRHLQDGREGLNSAESFDIAYGDSTAIQLGRMTPDSPLAKYLGLQPGDIVVAVNNNAVSKSNGIALYEKLKNENAFRVEIDRNGARFIVKYNVE